MWFPPYTSLPARKHWSPKPQLYTKCWWVCFPLLCNNQTGFPKESSSHFFFFFFLSWSGKRVRKFLSGNGSTCSNHPCPWGRNLREQMGKWLLKGTIWTIRQVFSCWILLCFLAKVTVEIHWEYLSDRLPIITSSLITK